MVGQGIMVGQGEAKDLGWVVLQRGEWRLGTVLVQQGETAGLDGATLDGEGAAFAWLEDQTHRLSLHLQVNHELLVDPLVPGQALKVVGKQLGDDLPLAKHVAG